jgi:hypothetical protein
MTVLTVYADTTDNYVSSVSGFDDEISGYTGTYAPARAGTGTPGKALGVVAGALWYLGQQYAAGNFYPTFGVYEAFAAFDTSSIPDTDTVSAAVLNVTSSVDVSTTDFTIQARLYDWGTAVETTDYVAGASITQTLLAHYATSGGFTANTAYDFVDDAFPANVNKVGSTRLLICSDRTVAGTSPTGNEYVGIKSADTTGTTSDPKLTVTHAAGAGWTTVTPPTASLTTATFAPAVTTPVLATVGVVSLTTAAFAPTVTATANVTATPPTASLSTTTYAPTVTAPALATVGAASLTTTLLAPVVTATAGQRSTPTPGALSLSTFAPIVVATDPKLTAPGTLALLLSGLAPDVVTGGVLPTHVMASVLATGSVGGSVSARSITGSVTATGAKSAEVTA